PRPPRQPPRRPLKAPPTPPIRPRRGAAAQPDPLAAVAAAPPSARTRSCLQPRDQILVPELAALRRAEDSLRADQERLHSKYRFMQPNPVSAR
ncbi:unnamed protein product, partial [Prorocentrum cordatum]